MNLTALRRVRDAMAAHPDRICMSMGWGDRDTALPDESEYDCLFAGSAFANCATVGCIAGWTVATLDPGFPVIEDGWLVSFTDLSDHAAGLLGLGPREARNLFYGLWARPLKPLDQITPQEVLTHLDRLLAPAEIAVAA